MISRVTAIYVKLCTFVRDWQQMTEKLRKANEQHFVGRIRICHCKNEKSHTQICLLFRTEKVNFVLSDSIN